MAVPDDMNGVAKPHLLGLFAGLFLAAGLVVSAGVATTAWFKVKTAEAITVKGSAGKNVRADLVVWKGSFTAQAARLLDAQQQLKNDADRVGEFIAGHHLPIYSGQTSWEGMNDTSSLDKTITAVVTATFALK